MRSHFTESMVRDEGVVSDEPIGQFLVEQVEVGREQVLVPSDAVFLDGAL